MRVIDPGHVFEVDALDGFLPQILYFVKREGPAYPGNVGHHSGTNIQEVLRALISRLGYLGSQQPCAETDLAAAHLESALYLLEVRAARRHGRLLEASLEEVVSGKSACGRCGHIGCAGSCRGHAGDGPVGGEG